MYLLTRFARVPNVGCRCREEGLERREQGPGRRSLFELADRLSGKQKQELACSFAVLQNTNLTNCVYGKTFGFMVYVVLLFMIYVS